MTVAETKDVEHLQLYDRVKQLERIISEEKPILSERMKRLNDRLVAEERHTIRLDERSGRIDGGTIKATVGIMALLWGFASTGFGYYIGSVTNPIIKELRELKLDVAGDLESMEGKLSSVASKGEVSSLQAMVANKASNRSVEQLQQSMQLHEAENSGRFRELDIQMNSQDAEHDEWQKEFFDRYTVFQIETNDSVARIDILCSLIRQTKTEIRKLDAINNQSVAMLYSELNNIRTSTQQIPIQIPERPGETGRDVDAC